jgi:hypothetical protein
MCLLTYVCECSFYKLRSDFCQYLKLFCFTIFFLAWANVCFFSWRLNATIHGLALMCRIDCSMEAADVFKFKFAPFTQFQGKTLNSASSMDESSPIPSWTYIIVFWRVCSFFLYSFWRSIKSQYFFYFKFIFKS